MYFDYISMILSKFGGGVLDKCKKTCVINVEI